MSKKTKTKTEPWKAAQPYILGQAQNIQGNQGQLQNNADTINSLLPGMADRINNPGADMTGAHAYLGDVLGGKYLNEGNPQLSNMIDQNNASVSDRVNSTFSQAGRTGGTQHGQILARELADSGNRLRYENYRGERDSMDRAVSLLPGLTGAEGNQIQALLQAAQAGGTLPLAGAQATGGLLHPYTTTTQSQGLGSTLANALGLGMMAFGGGGPLSGVFGGGGGGIKTGYSLGG